MKSIKEKAEELTKKRVELSREESIAYFQGIEEGANYVLNLLSETMHVSFAAYLRDNLFELIKELKK